MELWKYGNRKMKIRLFQLFTDIQSSAKIHKEQGKAQKYTAEGNNSTCSNYRGIALLSTIKKSILKGKLQPRVENILGKKQCGFLKGSSVTDTIFTVKQIMEKRRKCNQPSYMLRLDYKKGYIQEMLQSYNIPRN